MMTFDQANRWLANRVNLPTKRGSAEISREIPVKVRAHCFFSVRVAEARILERLREVSDAFSRHEIGLAEARTKLKEFLIGENGYQPGTGLTNLASTARLNLILEQNARMAAAVGMYQAGRDPDIEERFPCWRYIGSTSKNPRDSHAKYNGMVFRKDDPVWHRIFPPWDFGCKCSVEDCDDETSKPIKVDAPESGFAFDPAHAFEAPADLTNLTAVSRKTILAEAEEAVKNQTLGSVGLISAPATNGLPPAPLPKLKEVRDGFDAMEQAARKELRAVGLDPDHLPDYRTINQAFAAHGKQGKNIVSEILDKFPGTPFEVAKLNGRAAAAAGLEQVPVMLGRGNDHHGIAHLWRDHKELFVDPAGATRLLEETLGDPNCRVVVSLKRAMRKTGEHGEMGKTPICLKRVVLHNPEKQTYCVMVYDGKELKLVSWNNAGDDYGNSEWTLE